MTPEAAKAQAKRFLTDSLVLIRNVQGTAAVANQADVRGRMFNYQATEMSADVMQGDQKAILLADDLVGLGFPVPPIKGDVLMIQGRKTKVISVDPNTRKVDSVIICYECQVRGA